MVVKNSGRKLVGLIKKIKLVKEEFDRVDIVYFVYVNGFVNDDKFLKEIKDSEKKKFFFGLCYCLKFRGENCWV